jgi:hypothetical protein
MTTTRKTTASPPPRKPRRSSRSEPDLQAVPTILPITLEQIIAADGPLLDVVDSVVDQMTWLKSTDAGMVELARRYAKVIDDAVSISEDFADVSAKLWDLAIETDSKSLLARLKAVEKAIDVGKTVGWIGPLMANVLRDIGGSPAERKGLESDAPAKNNLEQMREGAKARGSRTSRR